MIDQTLLYIDKNKPDVIQTYLDLHELAEPSWEEKRTSGYIKERLKRSGLSVKTFECHHGLIAEIPGVSKEVIALRADMDALVQEVDGTVRANHSCGHDAHSTMVLYAAIALVESKLRFKHTLRFIFQPAEEKAEGALQMDKDGALENVKFLAGIHLRPYIEIGLGKASPVILHGSVATIRGTIKGYPAHAARPEEGNNPIEAAAQLIQCIRQIRLKDADPFSIKMTELHSGEASNSIPATARFTLDLRAKSNSTMNALLEKAQHVITKLSDLTETPIEYAVSGYSPAATKNLHAIGIAKEAIVSVLGEENLVPECDSPGAEDFHYYTLNNPHLVATMIGLGCNLKPGLHHPEMNFDHEALIDGTKVLTTLLIKADESLH